jgi:hypothetical protein
MIKRFRIEYINNNRKSAFLVARMIDRFDFELSDNSKLGPIDVEPVISQPRAITSDGTLDLSVYSFIPKERSQLAQVSIGQEVELQ